MISKKRTRRFGMATGVVFTALATGLAGTPAHAAGRHANEVSTWAAADDTTGGTLTEMTVRNPVHISRGGTGLRIRLSNVMGDQPVTFGAAYVGRQRSGPELVPGSNRRLSFGGRSSVTVPAGAVAFSDPLPGRVPDGSDLEVSLYLQGASGKLTAHNRTMQYTYKSTTGDHAAEESGTSFPTQSAVWFWLDAVVVTAPRTVSTVAALGDSITSGVGSTQNANHRWPDLLADRLRALPPARRLAVTNEGISANQVLKDGVGRSGRTRLVQDVLTKPGVRTVILFEGVNDIGTGGASADALIAGYRDMVAKAHAAGRCLIGATITPFGGSVYEGDRNEAVRQEVNAFIRTSGVFDGVVDYDQATRDPDDPTRLLPADDSGDHLHLSDAGYQAIADSVDLGLLRCDRHGTDGE
ncbi:SGNH/GDSL hydrolase family protein [Actinoallomurus iriomotensis]|uniref:SGNH hydrolase n=1 Tax=Actinoallomurus iriomotensis TaxID=478107 RepID=A0A9W6VZ32_9ACTN|nr:SGNH/GDSL hydrolase family protein [Actinoallomurus iriomotensis]GLY85490.1 SGNH hydrolase [Actinoallomurus iriomotensis]